MKVVVCQRELNRREWQTLPSRLIIFFSLLLGLAAPAAAQDIVLYPSDMTTIQGHYWTRPSSSSGAGGQKLASTDWGWASTDVAVPWPNDYVEATFQAQANVDYRIWVRVRANGDSKWNDSLWLQFNDSIDSGGNAVYRIGTGHAYLVNLESCNGCGVSGWGWSGGAWWVDQRKVRFPSSGSKTIRIQLREDGVEFDQIVLSPSTYASNAPGSDRNDATIVSKSGGSSGGGGNSGGGTTARALPGRVEAEDFDSGSNGSAYWDADGGNNGGAYRSTDVDIEPSSEGGHNVGWTVPGEWLNYTVNVAAAGTYTLDLRVAAPWGATMHVEFNGSDKTGAISLPSTSGWQSWTTVRRTVTLSAGTQKMRVVFDTGNANLNYIDVTSGGSSNPPPSSGSGPFGGTAHAIPGTIQSEDFDEGGPGVGYHDTTPGNSGGAYRSTNVDIEATSNGGHAVGWIVAGEWLNYSVNVTSGGTYTLTARVASAGSGGTFHVEFNGQDKTGAMRVPNTGSWTTYQDLSVTVQLDGGRQNMRVVFDSNGSTGGVGNISFVRLEQGSAPAPAPAPAPPPSGGSGGGRLRVMTWNIHFGHGGVWEQAQEIANANVDVVLLQEAQTWDEHMPTTYPDRLRQITGQQWYSKWAGGPDCGGGCQGTLILSRLPIVDSSTAIFSGTPVGRAAVDVGGVRVNLFTVHLEYYDTGKRSSQLQQMMDWTRQFGGPRIVGGDFNSWWGEWWIYHMETEYTDTWQDVTGSDENGYTLNGAVRFDYLFRAHEGNWRLTPAGAEVRWTSLSDHAPLVAEYIVR